jgi:hypothetical protein
MFKGIKNYFVMAATPTTNHLVNFLYVVNNKLDDTIVIEPSNKTVALTLDSTPDTTNIDGMAVFLNIKCLLICKDLAEKGGNADQLLAVLALDVSTHDKNYSQHLMPNKNLQLLLNLFKETSVIDKNIFAKTVTLISTNLNTLLLQSLTDKV